MSHSNSDRARARSARRRVGRVSLFQHHGSWWIAYTLDGSRVRNRIGRSHQAARRAAAVVNAQLETATPTLFSFEPVSVAKLRREFLDHHEFVQRSSLATVSRYAAATRHLEQFVCDSGCRGPAHEIKATDFARFLRGQLVAPNGHPHTRRRPLRDNGVRYILDTCRSMYSFARRKRYLPPYSDNPFTGLGGRRFNAEDAKPIYVFEEASELEFFQRADPWSFPIHITLAKTGLRPGELTHLLIEDVNLETGWLNVCSHPQLGWKIKTRRNRSVPIIDELCVVLWCVIGLRRHGPVILREKADRSCLPLYDLPRERLIAEAERCVADATSRGGTLDRREKQKVLNSVWRDAGAVRPEQIRQSFCRINASCGYPTRTCPKSWRHTFATLLQDANVDPLVRQITLGHSPAVSAVGALGMTSVYTQRDTRAPLPTRFATIWRNRFGKIFL